MVKGRVIAFYQRESQGDFHTNKIVYKKVQTISDNNKLVSKIMNVIHNGSEYQNEFHIAHSFLVKGIFRRP